jgi:hypothetical protein
MKATLQPNQETEVDGRVKQEGNTEEDMASVYRYNIYGQTTSK